MNEFDIIDHYFKPIQDKRNDIIVGVGDDAACLRLPEGHDLVVTTDTLVSGVHFLPEWDSFDIAYKSIMVNISDLAAMAANPCWATVALTVPDENDSWLHGFAQGLKEAFCRYNMALVGGDMTKGPLTINVTAHGTVPKDKAITRSTAKPGDIICVTGDLGGPALAVKWINQSDKDNTAREELNKLLKHPSPKVEYMNCLRQFVHAAIDISDGLTADLGHICKASGVGACIDLDSLPINPTLKQHEPDEAIDLALSGGDDYQLCFTVSASNYPKMLSYLKSIDLKIYAIGFIEKAAGLRIKTSKDGIRECSFKGYSHF